MAIGPRFGLAYDLTGTQSLVLRAGGGLFFDRPDGNTVFSIPGNPPIATSTDLRFGYLQNVGQAGGLAFGPVPAARACQNVGRSWPMAQRTPAPVMTTRRG